MKKLYLKLSMALCFVILISAGLCEAQALPDFSRWNGMLWKLSSHVNGYYFSDVDSPRLPDEKIRGSEILWGITTADISGTFTIDVYEKSDNGKCNPVERLKLVYFSGSSVDFMASYTNDIDLPGNNFSTGLVRVYGKMNLYQTAMNNGYIISLGAYSLKYDRDQTGDLAAYRLDLNGTKAAKLGCTLTQ